MRNIYIRKPSFTLSTNLSSFYIVCGNAAYPDQLLTVAFKGKAKQVHTDLENKTITVTGKVISCKGKPEIVITDPANIEVK